MTHEHVFWKRFVAVGVWANQHGRGTRIKYVGAICRCGAVA